MTNKNHTGVTGQIPGTPVQPEAEPVGLVLNDDAVLLEKAADAVAEGFASDAEVNAFVEAAPKAKQTAECFSPLNVKDYTEPALIALPTDTQENIEAAIEAMPNVSLDDTKEGSHWVETIKAARFAVPYRNWFTRTVNRKGSMFEQSVKSERGPLGISVPTFGETNSAKLTGAKAVLRVRSLIGLGSVVQVPLWHSGFWITLKAPSEGAMLELNRRLVEERIELGRQTYGLAFANTSSFFAGWVMDFIIDNHIFNSTLKESIIGDYRDRISVLDMPILIWGIVCTIWPRGFPFSRSVLSQDKKQNEVIKENLNVGKLLWPDTSTLSPWQIAHMANRSGNATTLEMLERYKNEFTIGKGRNVTLKDGLEMTLRIPTIAQYLTSGQKWINNIVSMVDNAFGIPPNEGSRDQYITDQGKATAMRQMAHFVESMRLYGTSIIDDEITIEQSLDALSTDDDIRLNYFKSIREYIEDSTMAVIAVPVTEGVDKSDLPRFPNLMTLDTLSVFFTLLVQKIQQIQNRQ